LTLPPSDPGRGTERAAARPDAAEPRTERWEGRSGAELAALWALPEVRVHARVGSTSDLARALAERGAPAGTLVLADEQTAGRGRAGRGWSSPAGLGLWLSTVLRPATLPHPGALPLLLGLRIAQALDRWVAPATVRIKWPNDLVLSGRKAAGLLCEGVWSGAGPAFVVAGIGVNVLHRETDFPPELRGRATSLGLQAGGPVPRLEVATAVAIAVRSLLGPEVSLSPADLDRLRARDYLRGRAVAVCDPANGAVLAEGLADGIAADGSLRVRGGDGAVAAVQTGTVRLPTPEER
jgi:BirA family transcriptional regulator, biotin operon repressor / biotin---[acetyl-CoA-carboxylase] ligase